MARPRSDIDRRIVTAARARFMAEGVDGASLRTIARAAGTSLGMISYYFPSKDDLFLAVVEDVYAGILRDLEHIFAAPTSFADRMRRVSVRVGTMSEHEAEVVRLVVREALLSSTRFRKLLTRFQRGHIPLVLEAVEAAVAQGEIAPIPIPTLLGCVIGVVGAPQILRRAVGPALPFDVPSVEETADIAAGVLLRGLCPPARRGRGPTAKKPRAAEAAPRRGRSGRSRVS